MMVIPRLISPTGRVARGEDAWGSGAWLARRGGRYHYGVDYVCEPGQEVVMPCTARVVRRKRPYRDDLSWDGVLLRAHGWEVTLFYVAATATDGTVLPQGAVIGTAQDIRQRYDARMTPHVHLEVEAMERRSLPPWWRDGVEYIMRGSRVMVDPGRLMRPAEEA